MNQGMVIPYQKLSPEALNGLIEEFVTRPGSDTGYTKNTLKQNVDMVKRQLERGDILVVYDEETQTANIIAKGEIIMGDKGKKDKGRKEQQKKAQLNLKEKRKLKKEKKQ